jgi:hypothetical protein
MLSPLSHLALTRFQVTADLWERFVRLVEEEGVQEGYGLNVLALLASQIRRKLTPATAMLSTSLAASVTAAGAWF